MSSRGAARARASLRDALAEVRSTHSSAELTAAVAKTLNKKERENLYARLRDEFSLPGTGSRDVAERVLEAVKQEAVEEVYRKAGFLVPRARPIISKPCERSTEKWDLWCPTPPPRISKPCERSTEKLDFWSPAPPPRRSKPCERSTEKLDFRCPAPLFKNKQTMCEVYRKLGLLVPRAPSKNEQQKFVFWCL